MKIEIIQEICCDDCGNIIHNHFICPLCQSNNSTEYFCALWEEEGVLEVQCEKCNVKFHTVSREGSIDDYEWEVNTRGLKMYS